MFPKRGIDQSDDSQGDVIEVRAGNRQSSVAGVVNIVADPDSIAGQYLPGRDTTRATSHEPRIRIIKEWLEECSRTHKNCEGAQPVQMPTRVLDLGDLSPTTNPKLFISEGQQGRYLALSYVWGENVRHKMQLEMKTVESFQRGIPESEMTLSHREALQVARQLGYRYIWIDAFGIIQDDKSDWAQQSTRIADVYGYAELTIMAGRSSDSREGFLDQLQAPPDMTCPLAYSRRNTSIPAGAQCFMTLPRSQAIGPVNERAWCFQEYQLSRRMVIYGEQQLMFKCRLRKDWEDGSYSMTNWASGPRYDIAPRALLDPRLTKQDIMNRWYGLAMMYSTKGIFDPTDNFAALAGVASRFQEALQCRFLAGLWECDLLRALLWRSRRLCSGPHTKQPLTKPIGVKKYQGRQLSRAPSWSWLALQGPVIHSISKVREAKLRDPQNQRCRPHNADGLTWSPDHWDPSTVVFPFPQCRLQVLGSPVYVRRSPVPTADFPRTPKWYCAPARLNRNTFLIEAADQGSDGRSFRRRIVAMGFLDTAGDAPEALWAMCLYTDEGLLLERNSDGTFSRLGVFAVEDDDFFAGLATVPTTLV